MPENSPIVLGIDPGSLVTGFGVITQHQSRLIHLQSGTISAPKSYFFEDRLKKIHEDLLSVIREASPTVMAIETVFYQKNVRSAVRLAHARGVALLAGAQMGLPIAEYSPAEVKRATVGYGQATKSQISEMMVRLFGLSGNEKKRLYDASDALAIALCHLNSAATKARVAKALSANKETKATPGSVL